jgi:negative regulator of flagellin synthesis FlgM
MGIDKIGPINNINNYSKVNKKDAINKVDSTDSVSISKEALNMAETNKAMEIVNSAPDVRADRVNEVKAKMNNPDYIDEIIAKSLADRIMKALNI